MAHAPSSSAAVGDVFDDILDLEGQYYQEGYALGVADGAQSGRVEGRIFGLEKGIEKFIEMGRLHGRATVWRMRAREGAAVDVAGEAGTAQSIAPLQSSSSPSASTSPLSPSPSPDPTSLLLSPRHPRLKKHIQRLYTLTNPHDLSTENSEDAVAEFDERLRDARAKAVLVARIVGEDVGGADGGGGGGGGEDHGGSGGGGEGKLSLRQDSSQQQPQSRRPPTGEIEDFVGLPGQRERR